VAVARNGNSDIHDGSDEGPDESRNAL
jgi:hypothetical protein